MRYTLLVNEQARPEALMAVLEREVGPRAKDTIVSIGQQLIEQGVQQGLQQGLEQGLEQGLQQGKLQGERALLLRLLEQRFGEAVDAATSQRIAVASAEQIERWADRVLSVATLAEVLAG